MKIRLFKLSWISWEAANNNLVKEMVFLISSGPLTLVNKRHKSCLKRLQCLPPSKISIRKTKYRWLSRLRSLDRLQGIFSIGNLNSLETPATSLNIAPWRIKNSRIMIYKINNNIEQRTVRRIWILTFIVKNLQSWMQLATNQNCSITKKPPISWLKRMKVSVSSCWTKFSLWIRYLRENQYVMNSWDSQQS